ncbi:MAG: SDR family NAD(P)-dependent oxidoreductase, partial [Pseudomonadota bacterium]|nr:SDR family NAD(P)-dependent oxidoreductase [Pseudomonadota bacterium]
MTETVLITGTNRGIGLELCRQLSAKGMHVIATCRHASKELKDLNVEIIEDVEVSEPTSLAKLADTLKGRNIDWVINNAGIAGGIGLGDIDDAAVDSFIRMYRVNSLGPLLVTQALLPNLHEGSKVGIITSRMGSIDDNDSGGSYA